MVYNPESEARGGNLRKPRNAVRCPVGWQSTESYSECWTKMSNPPRARLSNGRPCGEGELNEWGIWCTSNYQQISYQEAENAGVADANIYYVISQGSLENGTYFSPAATPIMNAKKNGGAPAPAASAPAPTQTAAAAPRDTRVGSLNPQRKSGGAFGLCPSMWIAGVPGTDLPDSNICYPSPGAGAMFPVGRIDAPCPVGYNNSVGFCVSLTPGVPAGQAAQSTQAATTNPNCPAPSSSTASAAGQALGGLLGGRRGGNSQAGAALGGLLGRAAAGAARPAGC